MAYATGHCSIWIQHNGNSCSGDTITVKQGKITFGSNYNSCCFYFSTLLHRRIYSRNIAHTYIHCKTPILCKSPTEYRRVGCYRNVRHVCAHLVAAAYGSLVGCRHDTCTPPKKMQMALVSMVPGTVLYHTLPNKTRGTWYETQNSKQVEKRRTSYIRSQSDANAIAM